VDAVNGALGILAQRLHGPLTGVGRYIGSLLDQWEPQVARGGFPFDRIVLLSREPLHRPGHPRIENRWRRSALPDALWEQVHVPRMARDLAVLFCPSYTAPLLSPCPLVVATLDMLQATRSSDFTRGARLVRGPLYRLSARRAAQVITLAEATVPEIVGLYGVDRARVHAVPLAADPRFTDRPGPEDAAVMQRCGLDDAPYVLFVGKLAPRRHIPELIAGFARAVETNHFPHRLVLAGPDPERLAIEGTTARVRHLGHVPDADLPALYRRADVVAYLSEAEGFGLPVVEAMRSGTPVLTLDRPVLREVAGDHAYYVQHATVGDIAGALTALLQDPAKRRLLAAGGLERAALFDWTVTGRRTLDILVRAAGGRAV
jgi:glycosyltransferase involved in cell wall biosynthesis